MLGDSEEKEPLTEQAEIIRVMIRHENELANHRASWLNAVQGLLFAALAFAWKDVPTYPRLVTLLALVGIAVAVLSLVALGMATYAITQLLGYWKKKGGSYSGPPVVGAFVKPDSMLAYLTPWNLLPLVFLVACVSILAIHA